MKKAKVIEMLIDSIFMCSAHDLILTTVEAKDLIKILKRYGLQIKAKKRK